MKILLNRSPSATGFLFVWVCLLGLSACSLISFPPSSLPGEALPTSNPPERVSDTFALRLVKRIEGAPGAPAEGSSHFGSAIAIYGDTLAVGAPERTALPRHHKGKVYVYHREGQGWTETARLAASNEDDGFQTDLSFGQALGLERDTLAVGAPETKDPESGANAGAVYIFQRMGNAWMETAILYSPQKTAEARFGEQVALRQDTLVVSGGQAVHVYHRTESGWMEQAQLSLENLAERDRFGDSLALDGDRIAVSATFYEPQTSRYVSSAVYLYQRTRDRWSLETKLSLGEGGWIGFGSSLDLQGETLIVGAGGDDTAGYAAGAVYLYEHGSGGWVRQTKLVAGDGPLSPYFAAFGSSVDLEGNLLMVGAVGDSILGSWAGSVYLFRKQGDRWIDLIKLWPEEADYLGGFFGADLQLSGNTLLVAAPSEYGNAVYIYEIGGNAP